MKRIFALFFAAFVAIASPVARADGIQNPTAIVQSNLTSATSPTASNDSTQGYAVGSLWQNSATGQIWIARSVAASAAVWTQIELSDHPGYIVGNWYIPAGVSVLTSGSAGGTNNIRMFPAYIKERITINALGVRISTLFSTGNVQAAIYANNPATGRPTGAVLASTASMSTTSAASVNAAVSVQLEPGLYWFATCMDNATSALLAVSNMMGSGAAATIGSATQANVAGVGSLGGLLVTGTFGTWPSMTSATFSELNNSAGIGVVQFQIGSVP